jgi:hypothetical protein
LQYIPYVIAASPQQPRSVTLPEVLQPDLCSSGCCTVSNVTFHLVNNDPSFTATLTFKETSLNCVYNCNMTNCSVTKCMVLPKVFPRWEVYVFDPFLLINSTVTVTYVGIVFILGPVFSLPTPTLPPGSLTSLSFQVPNLPPGLQLDTVKGKITGSPTAGGLTQSPVFVNDMYTGSQKQYATIIFDILVCTNFTCLNGGRCRFPYANDSCDCSRASGTGQNCQDPRPAQSSSSSSVAANVGIALSVVFGVAILINFAIQAYRSYDKRKTFHVFISYRVATDVKLAQHLYHALQSRYLPTGHRIRCARVGVGVWGVI